VKSYLPDGELVHALCQPMRKTLVDEVCAESHLSSVAYANLAVFIAVLFCFSGLGANAAIWYVLCACLVFLTTAVVGRFARYNLSVGVQFAIVLSIIFLNEMALVSILAFDVTSVDRANSIVAAAVVVSASFISVHLCARHTVPLILSKLCVVLACSVFLIYKSVDYVSSSEVLASLMVAFLIMVSTGYWIVLRRRQEMYLQVQLQQMKAAADAQNIELVKVLEEKEYSQKRFKDESQLRQKLITHIGHDLRQPISAAMYMLMEMRKTQQGGDQSVLIDDTHECIQSAGRMIENIVQFSHFDNLTIDVKPALVSLNEVLQSLHREYLLAAKNAQCSMRCVATSIVIDFDTELLKRILRNLIINVINHSDATKLLLGVRRKSNGIEVWVLDNGCGLLVDEDEPGLLVHAPASGGLGMGMKISKQLAQACDAQLDFYSQQGEGTLCKLAIPQSCIVKKWTPVVGQLPLTWSKALTNSV